MISRPYAPTSELFLGSRKWGSNHVAMDWQEQERGEGGDRRGGRGLADPGVGTPPPPVSLTMATDQAALS